MTDIFCPTCEEYFDDDKERYESGECPNCGREYYWEEVCNEDYTDCFSYIDWI